jgi:nitroreductase
MSRRETFIGPNLKQILREGNSMAQEIETGSPETAIVAEMETKATEKRSAAKAAQKKAPTAKKASTASPEAITATRKPARKTPKEPEKYSKAWFMKKKKEIDLSTWTETELVILRRRSNRIYQKKQVPEHLIRRILEAGRFAPTAGNYMHWRFSVVRDPKVLADMDKDAKRMLAFTGAVLDYYKHPSRKLFVKALQLKYPNQLHPIPHGVLKLVSEMSFEPFWHAPTVILLFKDVRGIGVPDLDLGICGQNMVIAAHSMGLGTCWVGLAGALGKLPKWKKFFDIQYPYELVQGICVGYPVGEADGFTERDTHAIDWFENGEKKVVY